MRHVAEALNALLEAHEIPCLLPHEAGGAFGSSVGGLAPVEIRVPGAQYEPASGIIKVNRIHQ